ncbi:MAG: hypothetical protein NC099_05835 [Corallococcus sp.]|nr:hypothetical protein [Corallococcus sp.]
MINIESFLDDIRKSVHIGAGDNARFFAWTFFYLGSDESIAIRVTEDDEGCVVFSDCHTTADYLEARDIDLNDRRDVLDRIVKRFGLIKDGNVFRMKIPVMSGEIGQADADYRLRLYLGYFIQALTLVAYIDL